MTGRGSRALPDGFQPRLSLAPGNFVRQPFRSGGQGGDDACGFAYADGIAADAVTGVRDEVSADAASGHHEAIHVLGVIRTQDLTKKNPKVDDGRENPLSPISPCRLHDLRYACTTEQLGKW